MSSKQHVNAGTSSAKHEHLLTNMTIMAAVFTVIIGFTVSHEVKTSESNICSTIQTLLQKQKESTASSESKIKSANPNSCTFWNKYTQSIRNDMRLMGFSKRHTDVALGMLSHGTYNEIARSLKITERTVREHAKTLFERTRCAKKSDFGKSLHKAIETFYNAS